MKGRRALHLMLKSAAGLAAALVLQSAPAGTRSMVADRVMQLTRESPWKLVASVPVGFPAHHPQGMVKIGDTYFVSSVEVRVRTRRFAEPAGGYDRDTGEGAGHLFKIDKDGKLIADLALGEGTMYHPGGIDFDGTHIWVPVRISAEQPLDVLPRRSRQHEGGGSVPLRRFDRRGCPQHR